MFSASGIENLFRRLPNPFIHWHKINFKVCTYHTQTPCSIYIYIPANIKQKCDIFRTMKRGKLENIPPSPRHGIYIIGSVSDVDGYCGRVFRGFSTRSNGYVLTKWSVVQRVVFLVISSFFFRFCATPYLAFRPKIRVFAIGYEYFCHISTLCAIRSRGWCVYIVTVCRCQRK